MDMRIEEERDSYRDRHTDIKQDVSTRGIFEDACEHLPRVKERVRFEDYFIDRVNDYAIAVRASLRGPMLTMIIAAISYLKVREYLE